jgi:VanZ family protein
MKNRPFLPAIVFGVLIFVSSSLPTRGWERVQALNKFFRILLSDYSLHFFAFGIFAVLLCYGFLKKDPSTLPCFKVGLISVSFGLFIEVYHSLLSYRSFSLNDLLSNLAGILVALILVRIFIAVRSS